jgi:hypothetical protein
MIFLKNANKYNIESFVMINIFIKFKEILDRKIRRYNMKYDEFCKKYHLTKYHRYTDSKYEQYKEKFPENNNENVYEQAKLAKIIIFDGVKLQLVGKEILLERLLENKFQDCSCYGDSEKLHISTRYKIDKGWLYEFLYDNSIDVEHLRGILDELTIGDRKRTMYELEELLAEAEEEKEKWEEDNFNH